MYTDIALEKELWDIINRGLEEKPPPLLPPHKTKKYTPNKQKY